MSLKSANGQKNKQFNEKDRKCTNEKPNMLPELYVYETFKKNIRLSFTSCIIEKNNTHDLQEESRSHQKTA